VGEKTEPMLVIDGMPVPTDTSDKISGSEPSPLMMALNRIDPALVDFIEVLTGPEAAIYGVRGGNGVIVVNTKSRLVIDDPSKVNGMRNLIVKGFHIPEIFEQRDYSIKENKNVKIPDTRSLIYWNGDGLTDANGKATVSFYTADAATTYTVIVTGMTAKGFRFQKQIIISRK
jgi:TonB-dependent SusC/RagA subfamily outer membrane receptor